MLRYINEITSVQFSIQRKDGRTRHNFLAIASGESRSSRWGGAEGGTKQGSVHPVGMQRVESPLGSGGEVPRNLRYYCIVCNVRSVFVNPEMYRSAFCRWIYFHLRSKIFWPSHTHPFNGRLSETTRVSRYQKGKTNQTNQIKETMSGSGISWAICKSAPRSRQTTTTLMFFTGRMPFLPPNQQRQSTEGTDAV